MATSIILSRLSPEAFSDPKDFKKLADKVSSKIKSECPGVVWKESYATMRRFDVVDIVESDNSAQLGEKAWVRLYGNPKGKTYDQSWLN